MPASDVGSTHRNGLLELGLNPPEAPPEGFLYIPDSDFSVLHKAGLWDGTGAAVFNLMEKIPRSPNECSLREAMEIVDEHEKLVPGRSEQPR